jgi:hypothetical protein
VSQSQSRRRVSLQSGRESGAFSLQPASEQRRSVDSQERQEYGTVRESASTESVIIDSVSVGTGCNRTIVIPTV